MKQLTDEQQEQAIEIIQRIANNEPKDWCYESAKAFLNSLKPKVYVCYIDGSDILYLNNISEDYWTVTVNGAFQFNSIEEARKLLNSIIKYENCKYFILTE